MKLLVSLPLLLSLVACSSPPGAPVIPPVISELSCQDDMTGMAAYYGSPTEIQHFRALDTQGTEVLGEMWRWRDQQVSVEFAWPVSGTHYPGPCRVYTWPDGATPYGYAEFAWTQ